MHSSKLIGQFPALMGLPVDAIACISSYLSSSEVAQTLTLCHEWRNILVTIPSLWRRLDVVLSNKQRQYYVPLHRIVAYSNRLPLELHLHGIHKAQCATIVSVLRETMYRVRDLSIWVNNEQEEADVKDSLTILLDALCEIPAPALSRFAVGCSSDQPKYSVSVPYEIFSSHAPKLTVLVLDKGVWLDENNHTPAFRKVEVLTACPDVWDLTIPLRLLPGLDVMHLCGPFNPSDELVPIFPPEYPPPDGWRPFDTLGFRISQLYDLDLDDPAARVHDALNLAYNVMQSGVKHVFIRSDDANQEILMLLGTLVPPTHKMSITSGGHDFGLERAHSQATGLTFELTDSRGRTVTVAHTDKTSSNVDPSSDSASYLWGAPWPDMFTKLTHLSLCESLLALAGQHLAQLGMPEVSTLVIYIMPSSRHSSPELYASDMRSTLLTAPKLRTLQLGISPEWPKYACGGNMINTKWSQIVIDQFYEVSALSVCALIKKRLVFREHPLREVVVDPRIFFSERSHSTAVDTLRNTTRSLRFASD